MGDSISEAPLAMGYYEIPEIYKKAAPWICMYIAMASLVCVLCMVADLTNGFLQRKWWIPSKFFSFNAATLTLLGVGTKLASAADRSDLKIIKELSLVFLSITMTHAMTSLYDMDGVTMFSNVIALGILVISTFVDIQIEKRNGDTTMEMVAATIMFCNFWYLVCHSLMVPATRKRLERQYKSLHNEILQEMSKMDDATKLSVNKLKEYMRKYWLLALTSSPDYVLRKSKLSCLCALQNVSLSFIVILTITYYYYKNCNTYNYYNYFVMCNYFPKTEYGWAFTVIVWVQAVGIIIGVLISLLRGLDSIPFVFNIFKSLFSINKNDYQLLREWMEAPLPFQIRVKVLRKLVSITRMMLVAGLMVLQFATLTFCKFSLLILCVIPLVPITLTRKLFLMLFRKLWGVLVKKTTIENDDELAKYVLHQKEKNLSSSKMVVQQWKNYHDDWIKKGKMKQPQVLYSFLKSHSSIKHGFRGLRDIYSIDISSTKKISKYDPSKCWGLILVTLGGIVRATSLHVKDERLMDCIDEALKYMLFVDQALCEKGSRKMRSVAKMVWEGVYLDGRWLDVNLATIASSTDPRSSIFKLNVKSREYMKEFENVSAKNWSTKVFAVSCMYIITETELQKHHVDYVAASGWSVNWLEGVVVDLIGACLTNLALAIFTHCSSGKIGLREDKVRESAFILGETHNILDFLEKNGTFCDYPQNKESFESWCNSSSYVC